IDVKIIKREGNLELLPYLYKDEAGWTKLRDQIRQDAGVNQARGYFEKGQVLAPKFSRTYQVLAAMHSFNHDVEAIRKLHKQVQEIAVDVADENRILLETYSGKNAEKRRKELAGSLTRQLERVKAARAVGGPTLAAALGILIQARMADEKSKPDEIV